MKLRMNRLEPSKAAWAGILLILVIGCASLPRLERWASDVPPNRPVVDGIWSTVGSTNMELWSFLRNDEINAVVVGADFAARMELLFQEDLRTSDPIDPEEWRKRPISRRLAEWTSQLLRYWL